MRIHASAAARGVTLLLILSLSACKTTEEGDTIVNPADPSAQAVMFTTEGWNAFESKNYANAVSSFKKAIASNDGYGDAYNGLGWSYARLDSLEKSLFYFDVALGQQPTMIDALAGHAFVDLALRNYGDAVTAVATIQSQGLTFYAFRHDPNITMKDLLLVKAQSYFMLGNYPGAQELLDQLDPHNGLDPSSNTYLEDLSLEIETLWTLI